LRITGLHEWWRPQSPIPISCLLAALLKYAHAAARKARDTRTCLFSCTFSNFLCLYRFQHATRWWWHCTIIFTNAERVSHRPAAAQYVSLEQVELPRVGQKSISSRNQQLPKELRGTLCIYSQCHGGCDA